MNKKDLTIKERLAILETLMTNHLKHHEKHFYIMLALLPPILGGVGWILCRLYGVL